MPGFARTLKHIEGAAQVHIKIKPGIDQGGGDCNLRRKVVDLICGGDGSLHESSVANIANRNL